MTEQPVIRMGEMRAKPGQEGALEAFIYRVIVPSLRTADGCRAVDVWQDAGDPTRFLIVEHWDSVAAHRASVGEIDPDDIKEVMGLLADSPHGQYYVALSE